MTEEIAAAIEVLAPIVEGVYATHADEIEHHKTGRHQMDADDFLWRRLLVSMATMGNSRGWDGLIGNEGNYRLVTFQALSALEPTERLERLRTVLQRAKVRMPDQKAGWLAQNFDRIEAMGGLEAANERFRVMNDRDEIIAFLRSFAGIGPKYARNIPMDIYHPAFRDSVAVDERIQNVSKTLGLSFASFQEHEDFYRKVAQRAGLEGWELDRLLYNFNHEILGQLRSTATQPTPGPGISPGRTVPREEPRDAARARSGPTASPLPVDDMETKERRDLFQEIQQTFRDEFPRASSYTRANGWFYGRGTNVFFVARPQQTGRVEIRLHASKDQLPDTYLDLDERLHSGRADPPVQFIDIDSNGDVPEIMRLAHFAYRFWGSA